MSRLYHLSYDTINCDGHFDGNHDEARRYILCVVNSSPVLSVHSYTESSLILEYEIVESDRLFRFLRNNLAPYFYYSVSLVAKNINTGHEFINHNPNLPLNTRLQRKLQTLVCDNLGKRIVDY